MSCNKSKTSKNAEAENMTYNDEKNQSIGTVPQNNIDKKIRR